MNISYRDLEFTTSNSMNPDKIYQKIGEFVVLFQWIEHTIRQIGWLIIDPEKKIWPPLQLREESNQLLLNKVENLFLELPDEIKGLCFVSKKKKFKQLIEECHELRQYRNRLLHAAFIELKAGGEVLNIISTDKRIRKDESGDFVFDYEDLTEESMATTLRKLGELGIQLNHEYLQLIHLLPE